MGQSEQPGATKLDLAQAVADLQEDEALEIVRLRMARGDDPMRIIDDCQVGMREVGERYGQERYFLSGLIVAGEILGQIMDIVLPAVDVRYSGQSAGRVLIGTVQGDIHDLGKNMVTMLLRSYGFSVLDLGVDVSPDRFVKEARAFKPHLVGLSGLMTAAYGSMRETVSALRTMMAEEDDSIPIVLGGQVDAQVCRYADADHWTIDAMQGVRLCQRLVGEG
jgi:methanogenic corrinoid protein MtbC1